MLCDDCDDCDDWDPGQMTETLDRYRAMATLVTSGKGAVLCALA